MSVNEKMTALADAIREKSGVTGKLTIDGMTSAVKAISSLIVASASGNPIVLNDSTDLRVQSLRLFGKTTQNGTPSPNAPVPLVSAGDGGSLGVTVAGKNLLNYTGNLLTNGNGTVSAAEGYISAIIPIRNVNSVYVSGDFTLLNYSMIRVGLFNEWPVVGSIGKRESWTSGGIKYCSGYQYMMISLIPDPVNDEMFKAVKNSFMLSIGETQTEYEPYNGQTLTLSTPNGLPGIPVTSGGNYTDETGQQWVCDEVDFGRGIYVQRIFGTVFKSAVGWNIAGTKNGLKRFYTNQFMGVIKNAKDEATKECALCSHFINVTASDTWNEVTGISVNSKGRLDIFYSGIEQTTAALDVYFSSNPVAFMAELATPIETSLSAEELAAYAALHTNYPNTAILNDGGAGMEVKYVADTKNYIDNQIATVAAAIVNS